MALIFAVSAMPDPGRIPGGVSDKTAHVVVYATLGAALMRALAAGCAAGATPGRVVLAGLLASAYGLTDELHQMFVPGRTPDWMDVVADTLGGFGGALLWAGAARLYSFSCHDRSAAR